jgi:PhnB protein
MPQLNAYLTFAGNCAEAMRFYAQVLGAELRALMTYGEASGSEQMPPGNADRIMHAYLVHPEFVLMAGDAMQDQSFDGMRGFGLALTFPDVAEAKRVFGLLAEGGHIDMPLGETFWAAAFGSVTDRFGTPWLVNGGPKEV